MIIMIALVVLGTISCLIRVPTSHHDVVWAEDANIFLFENLNLGPWASLFHGYAGYQHLVPRVGSALALGLAPLADYAIVTFWMCSILTGVVGAAVYWLSRDVLQYIPARVTAALITFVLPLSMQEVIGNWADIHTYFMWLTPWLIFYRPRSWWSGSMWAVVAFVAIMTEVQAMLFLVLLPFFIRRRYRYSFPIFVAFMVGAAWQLLTVATVHRDTTAAWLGIPSLLQGWLINVPLPMVLANPAHVRLALSSSGFVIPVIVTSVFLCALVITLVKGTPAQRLLAITFLVASGAIYAAGATVDGSWWFSYADSDAAPWERLVNSRYGVAAGFMLAGLIPVAAAALMRRDRSSNPSRGACVVAWYGMVGLMVVFAIAGTQAVSSRSAVAGPWSPAVVAAAAVCQTALLTDEQALPVAPERVVVLTCAQILR